jgi:hypothetical protein
MSDGAAQARIAELEAALQGLVTFLRGPVLIASFGGHLDRAEKVLGPRAILDRAEAKLGEPKMVRREADHGVEVVPVAAFEEGPELFVRSNKTTGRPSGWPNIALRDFRGRCAMGPITRYVAFGEVRAARTEGIEDGRAERQAEICAWLRQVVESSRGTTGEGAAERWVLELIEEIEKGADQMKKKVPAPAERYPSNACAVRERTADLVSVGRCWFNLEPGDVCPRHGDVREVMQRYRSCGKLTDELDLPKKICPHHPNFVDVSDEVACASCGATIKALPDGSAPAGSWAVPVGGEFLPVCSTKCGAALMDGVAEPEVKTCK